MKGAAQSLSLRADWVPRIAGAVIAAIGLIVLAGWFSGHVAVATLNISKSSMKANTALGLALAGASLILASRRHSHTRELIGQLLGAVAAGIGLLSAIEIIAAVNLGIDQVLVPDQLTMALNSPGRMSLITASCFMIFGCGRVAAGYTNRYAIACHLSAGILGIAVSYVTVLGYLYDAALLYHPIPSTSIALHTALAFLILFIGLQAARPDLGWAARLRSPGAGGTISRWMLPTVSILLPAIGWLRLQGELAGFYDTRVGLALFTAANALIICAIVWLAARKTDHLENERQQSLNSLRLSELSLQETAEDLRDTTELMMAVIDASPISIVALDPAGDVAIWNRAAETTLGYALSEVVGKRLPDALFPVHGALNQWLEPAEADTTQIGLEAKLRRKDGKIIDTVSSVASFSDPAGAIRGTVVLISDVTDHNVLQARLRQAQKMEAIGNLTGGLAHDFNNLLGVIIGNLDLIDRNSRAASGEAELIDDALAAADHAAELTRALLAFARQQPLRPEIVMLEPLIDETVKMLRRLIGENIEIVTEYEPGVCSVRVDPTLLATAFTNLATNARDAMPSGGRLLIQTSCRLMQDSDRLVNFQIPPGSYAVITVSDEGNGIPPENLDRIFEPFFTSKGPDQGTGLGLSMVFGFVKQSGGHINVYSEVGIGTTFRLYFPCTISPPPEASAEAEGARRQNTGETILVVEDNPQLRRTVIRQLTGLHYEVLCAGNGEEALEQLESNHIDLVFSDVVMPGGIDGFELARRMSLQWPQVKILLTSGFPDKQGAKRTSRGEPALLNKPYRVNDLAKAVRQALDGDTSRPVDSRTT